MLIGIWLIEIMLIRIMLIEIMLIEILMIGIMLIEIMLIEIMLIEMTELKTKASALIKAVHVPQTTRLWLYGACNQTHRSINSKNVQKSSFSGIILIL